ncbi:hypothetical protein Tco_0540299 [Tanacetum coccineum]
MVRAKELFTWTPSFESIKEQDYSSDDESVQGVGSKENKYNTYEKEEGEFNNSEDEEVAETDFMEKSSQSMEHSVHVDKEISADPFGLNDLLGLKKPVEENLEPSPSLSHPPGFSPVGSLNSSDKELNKEFSPTISAKFVVLDEDDSCTVGLWGISYGGGVKEDIEAIINCKGDEAVLDEFFKKRRWRRRSRTYEYLNDLMEMEDMDFVRKQKSDGRLKFDENSNRLAMVIAGLVSNTQSAFVAGRQILDGPFILNEDFLLDVLGLLDIRVRLGVLGLEVPKGVLKVMESIRSNFFKGASMLEKKISWIAWDKVLASKKKGGLGVSSYFALNRALLLKWVWRFVSQDDSLWFRVIQAVHGDKIDSHSVRNFHMEFDFEEVQVLKSSGLISLSYCSKRIRVVLSTSNDRWYFSLSSSGEFSVKDTRLAIDDLVLPSHSEPTRRFCIVFAVGGRSISSFGVRSQNGTRGSSFYSSSGSVKGCAPAPAPAGYRRRDVDPLCSSDDDCKARCPYSPYPYCDLSTNKCICAKGTKPPRRDNA